MSSILCLQNSRGKHTIHVHTIRCSSHTKLHCIQSLPQQPIHCSRAVQLAKSFCPLMLTAGS